MSVPESRYTRVIVDGRPAVVGEFKLDQQWRTFATMGPRPDTAWSTTDAAGHFHAFSAGSTALERYPTLRAEEIFVPLDGDDNEDDEPDGYTMTEYHCRICGELVKPGTIAGLHTTTKPGLKSWTVVVYDWLPRAPTAAVSVRVLVGNGQGTDQTEHFGVGEAVAWEHGDAGSRTTIAGNGPLGTRKGRVRDFEGVGGAR